VTHQAQLKLLETDIEKWRMLYSYQETLVTHMQNQIEDYANERKLRGREARLLSILALIPRSKIMGSIKKVQGPRLYMHISTLQALIARCIAICAACNNRNGQHCAEEDPQDAWLEDEIEKNRAEPEVQLRENLQKNRWDCLTGKLTEMRADLEDCQAEASNRVRETLGAKVRRTLISYGDLLFHLALLLLTINCFAKVQLSIWVWQKVKIIQVEKIQNRNFLKRYMLRREEVGYSCGSKTIYCHGGERLRLPQDPGHQDPHRQESQRPFLRRGSLPMPRLEAERSAAVPWHHGGEAHWNPSLRLRPSPRGNGHGRHVRTRQLLRPQRLEVLPLCSPGSILDQRHTQAPTNSPGGPGIAGDTALS
ncbi:Gamt, partial [Symbiodinium sp. KB8]